MAKNQALTFQQTPPGHDSWRAIGHLLVNRGQAGGLYRLRKAHWLLQFEQSDIICHGHAIIFRMRQIFRDWNHLFAWNRLAETVSTEDDVSGAEMGCFWASYMMEQQAILTLSKCNGQQLRQYRWLQPDR